MLLTRTLVKKVTILFTTDHDQYLHNSPPTGGSEIHSSLMIPVNLKITFSMRKHETDYLWDQNLCGEN